MKKIFAIALAVLMLAGLATVAFAADSANGTIYHKVNITLNLNGKTEALDPQTVTDGDSITITAPEREGFTFEKMVISGDFRNEKTYTEKSVTITPLGDIDVVIYYTGSGSTNPGDNGNTSPQTGADYTLAVLVAVIGLFGMAIATKKIFVK